MREKYRHILALIAIFVLLPYNMIGHADKSNGDLQAFCPYMCTSSFNNYMKNYFDLNETQAAILQVSLDSKSEGTFLYANLTHDIIFLFDGASSEYDTAESAYIYCSLKEDSTLKNIPMILWAVQIEAMYFGTEAELTGSFLEWVNDGRKDGEIFDTQYFTAVYSEEPNKFCSMLLTKK